MDRNKIIDKNMLTKIFRKIHRILGLLLSILFLMWFISGIVMIYHSFPRVNQKLKLARQESLTGPLPAVDSLLQVLPNSSRLGGLSVDMYLDRPVFHLKGRQLPAGLYADSLQVVGKPDFNEICRIAGQLGGSVAYRVDSLNRLDQWIPFGYLMMTGKRCIYLRKAVKCCNGLTGIPAFGLGWGLFLIGCILLLYGKIKRFGLIL